MSKSFLTPIGLFSAATDPSSASIGNVYFNTASNVMRLYFNSQWNSVHNVTASYGLDADHIDFSTNPSSAASVARLQWSPGEGTLSFGLGGGNIFLNIGQEEVALCYNGTASTLTKGTVVYISGAQGQRPTIDKASASAEGESSKTLGVVAENIASGSEGFVCTSGILRNVNTSSFPEGSALWLSTTPGQMTTSKLYAPNHLVFIGYSIKQSANAGQIFIKIQNGLELYELHNVSASAPANNDILVYNTSSSLWFNSSSANLANLTVTNTINGRAASANAATHAGTASSIAGSLVSGYVASANVATHAGTASSIAGSLVTGTVANASHANTASSINASLITGTTLPAAIINSSLTSVGTLTNLTVTNTISGRAASATIATHANTASSIAGSLVTGTVANATHASTASSINASLLTGTTLPASIVSSSLTGVGTLTNLTVTNTISGRAASANVSTHAGTASSIAGSLVTGTVSNASHANTASSINASLVSGSFGSGGVVINSNEGASNTSALSAMTGRLIFSNAFSDTARGPNKVQMYNDASAWIGGFGVHAETLSYYTGGAHRWYRSSNQTTFTELMALSASGFLGIATNSPASALHVIGAALVTTNLNVDSGTLYVDGTSNAVNVGTTSHLGAKVNILNDVSGSVGFLLRGAAGQSVSAFRIQSSGGTNTVNINSETGGGYFAGNFGIGSLVPDAKLDVNGEALIRTNASVTGNLLVDTNTLFVDATNNEVGILTTSPASALHVAGGLLVNGNASFGGTITGTSTTQAVGNSSTSLATTEFVSRSVKYSADTSVNTSSVAGFFVFNVSGTASLGGVIMMPRGTAARVIVGQANIGINGAASAGFVRGYVENNAGTAVALGGAVPFYYIAW